MYMEKKLNILDYGHGKFKFGQLKWEDGQVFRGDIQGDGAQWASSTAKKQASSGPKVLRKEIKMYLWCLQVDRKAYSTPFVLSKFEIGLLEAEKYKTAKC